MTRVIHIRDAPKGWQDDPMYVYIGRRNNRAGLAQSYWANPYHIGPDGDRDMVIQKCILDNEHRLALDEDYRAAVRNLAGKTLVCYCKSKEHPDTPCHGDWLAEQADRLAVEWDAYQHSLKCLTFNAAREARLEALLEEERRLSQERLRGLHQTLRQKSGKIKGRSDAETYRRFRMWREKFFRPIVQEGKRFHI